MSGSSNKWMSEWVGVLKNCFPTRGPTRQQQCLSFLKRRWEFVCRILVGNRCKKFLECKWEMRAVMMRRTGVRNAVIMDRRYKIIRDFWKIAWMKHFTGSWKRGIWNSSTRSVSGYETYRPSPEVGKKHFEILSGLDLAQKMSTRFHSMMTCKGRIKIRISHS